MSKDYDNKKRIELAEYRASIAEAELNAIRQSKVYKTARSLSVVKNKIKSDPIGLAKKAASTLVNNPRGIKLLGKRVNRIEQVANISVDQNNKYQEWIILNEPDEPELEKQRLQSDKFNKKPLISIVTPVFNPPVDVLEVLIESVLEQTYPNFELCLGDFGDSEGVDKLLKRYSKFDSRIKYKKFNDNQGISGNSNQILKALVKGDYIALLDHDDTISPDALFENVKKINEGDYDFLYSDKDKIDIDGHRFEPLFKPQLSPDMLLNINYLTHLNVMKTSIIRQIGGWDKNTDGAQDWDLFLRFITVSDKVAHIPKILYHWRVIASSTALSIETKPYALAGQRMAVDKYLEQYNIKAKTYHKQTELLLKWDEKAIDRDPIVFIYFSNISNTIRAIRYVRKNTNKAKIFILVCSPLAIDATDVDRLKAYYNNVNIINYKEGDLFNVISKSIIDKNNKTALFIKDSIRFPSGDWYSELNGWVSINNVGAASGRIVDQYDTIVDSGGLITANGSYYPIFKNFPKLSQCYIGNAEWVRDLSIISSSFFITKTNLLKEFNFSKATQINPMLDDFFLWLNNKKRIVLTPNVTGMIHDGNKNTEQGHKLNGLLVDKEGLYLDKFSNPNMNKSDPFKLLESEETESHNINNVLSIDKYQNDAIILASSFDISKQEIDSIKFSNNKTPETVAWFLPSYDAVYAGLMNIFRFANYLFEKKGLKTTFYILKDSSNVDAEKKRAAAAFPLLNKAKFIGIRPDQISAIKKHDIGIATQWATAYPLAKATNVGKRLYFIQDNEVNFYPKGTISSLVDLTYRFGFVAIANTEGLLDMYKNKYNGNGVVVKSYVDLSSYFPREDVYYKPKAPYKVFFYARPNMPRNAFELGIAGLKKLKEQLGKDVEITTAGEKWNAESYGVDGLFTNLGKIEYNSVPKLYRSVDAGLMFMFSGHPGVTASELMASGCPVVVNEYDDITWHELYKDEVTCLTTKATASEVARNIRRLLEDDKLRKKLIDNGLKTTKTFYDGYDESCDEAFKIIEK